MMVFEPQRNKPRVKKRNRSVAADQNKWPIGAKQKDVTAWHTNEIHVTKASEQWRNVQDVAKCQA